MELLIEKSFTDDTVKIVHPQTLETIAKRTKRNGSYIWLSGDPDIQELCDEYSAGTTIGGMALLIADALKCS